MIPYEGFRALDTKYRELYCEENIARLPNWEDYARETLEFSEDYFEIFTTIIDVLNENIELQSGVLPIFVQLKDRKMVTECLTWLRKKAGEQKNLYEGWPYLFSVS